MEYYVSSFSGDDSNDGLTPATAFENAITAWLVGATGDKVLFSDAQVHIPSWGATFPGFLQVGAYHEAGGADFTLQTPIEAALGIAPRVAARFDGTTVASAVQIGWASYEDISFYNNNPGSTAGYFIDGAPDVNRVFIGCEFSDLGGKDLMFMAGTNLFQDCWIHNTQGSKALYSSFGLVKGGLIEVDENPSAAMIIFTGYRSNVFQDVTVVISTPASNGNMITVVDYNDAGSDVGLKIRNNTIYNLSNRNDVTAFDASLSLMTYSEIVDNVFYGLDQAASGTIIGLVGQSPLIIGSNSYYDSNLPPTLIPTNIKMDITDEDYVAAADPFIDGGNYDFRINNTEATNNISSTGNNSFRGAIQSQISNSSGGNNIFILND